MIQVPVELLCPFLATNRHFLSNNLLLNFKSVGSLVYYLDSLLHVDISTSKTALLAAPAGIAVFVPTLHFGKGF